MRQWKHYLDDSEEESGSDYDPFDPSYWDDYPPRRAQQGRELVIELRHEHSNRQVDLMLEEIEMQEGAGYGYGDDYEGLQDDNFEGSAIIGQVFGTCGCGPGGHSHNDYSESGEDADEDEDENFDEDEPSDQEEDEDFEENE